MKPARTLAALAAAGSLVLGACTSGGSDEPAAGVAPSSAEVTAVLEELADEVIVPAYVAFAEATDAFSMAVEDLCAQPSTDTLAEARDAWRPAVEAWQRTRAGAVGPAMERRLMSAVAFEARPTLVDDLLAGDEPVDVEGLGRQGAAVRGLYAAEYALFGPDADELASLAGARRCRYLASVAARSATAAAEVADDWEDGAAREAFASGGDDGPQATVSLLTNEVSRRLDEIDAQGLRDLSEATTPADLAEGRGDGPAAHRVAELRALGDGVVAVIGGPDSGLVAVVAAQDPDTADRLRAASDAAGAATAALGDSVVEALDDPEALDEAAEQVADLKVLVSTEVATKLGVTITFSDSDGDG